MSHSNLSQRIGAAIKLARTKQRLSQDTLAKTIGISQAQLSRYEKGTDNLSMTQVERIFAALGMDVNIVGVDRT